MIIIKKKRPITGLVRWKTYEFLQDSFIELSKNFDILEEEISKEENLSDFLCKELNRQSKKIKLYIKLKEDGEDISFEEFLINFYEQEEII